MKLLDTIKSVVSMGTGQLPSLLPGKAPTKPVALPSFKTRVERSASPIQRADRRLANTDVTTFRASGDTRQVIRDFVSASPDLSATLASYLRVGIPERYTVVAREMDGAISVSGTQLAQEILRRVTFLGDDTLGYNPVTDLQSLSESIAKELIQYGSGALELALDKQMAPTWFTAVSVTKLEWKEEDGGVYPEQVIGSVRRKLDIPTFFYVSIDQDLLTPYSSSYFESAVQAVIADAQFLNNLRNAMARSLQPRLIAEIVEEKFKDACPPEISNDPDKYAQFCSTTLTSISDLLSNLAPDDALVSFDSIKYSTLGAKDTSAVSEQLKTVQHLLESKIAAGAKTMPAIMGREAGSSAASTTAMLFLKNADVVRRKLNVLYSRALTQSCRLLGEDVYVEFTYAELDLRPSGELEAYKSMEQSRVMELLSMGFITDDEACIMLTGNLPPAGYTPKSGTMFGAKATAITNPESQTSTAGGGKDKLKPGTPAAPKD